MTGEHRIRLQAAWHVTAGGRVWTRSFGRPTGVGAGARIWLEIALPLPCSAVLNGRRLAPVVAGSAAWRHDVTAELGERNDLRLEYRTALPAPATADRVTLPAVAGSVTLVITGGADDAGALDTRSP